MEFREKCFTFFRNGGNTFRSINNRMWIFFIKQLNYLRESIEGFKLVPNFSYYQTRIDLLFEQRLDKAFNDSRRTIKASCPKSLNRQSVTLFLASSLCIFSFFAEMEAIALAAELEIKISLLIRFETSKGINPKSLRIFCASVDFETLHIVEQVAALIFESSYETNPIRTFNPCNSKKLITASPGIKFYSFILSSRQLVRADNAI